MISYPLADDPTQMLIAVYDGHGLNGEVISEYAAYALVDALEADPNALINDPSEHLRRSIVSMDDGMRNKRSIPSYDSGSTAIVALLRGRQVWVACVGDSRAICSALEVRWKWKLPDPWLLSPGSPSCVSLSGLLRAHLASAAGQPSEM